MIYLTVEKTGKNEDDLQFTLVMPDYSQIVAYFGTTGALLEGEEVPVPPYADLGKINLMVEAAHAAGIRGEELIIQYIGCLPPED